MSAPGKLQDGEVYLASYLIERLIQLGVNVMYGVPGDFNLVFLDEVEAHPNFEWIGCCNELNAGYAADGYARVKQSQANSTSSSGNNATQGGVKGLAALCTTFGVGELSAMNAIAGAYSERVPILHIVGAPSTSAQKNGFLLHHTLGDGKFNVFKTATQGVTAAQAFLESGNNAAEEIDRVLRIALETARPTYMTLPTDLVYAPVSKARLDTPVIPPAPTVHDKSTLPTGIKLENGDVEKLNFVSDEIERLWATAKNPILIVDACAIRYGVAHLVRDLIDATKIKYFSTPMGKGVMHEDTAHGFGGVYVGAISDPEVKKAVEAADLTIMVGAIKSDFNTGEFSYEFDTKKLIELHSDHTVVQYADYPGVSFHTLLPALARSLKAKDVEPVAEHAGLVRKIPEGSKDGMVKQEAFWPLWGKFFKEDDIVIAETGTSSFGMIDVPLPRGGTFVSQVLWGSIGWAGGALLGCLLAAREAGYPRRTILFIGDGSLQLTVQEISTMLRHDLCPIIVLLNNDGYVIERLIHGPEAVYNDISHWKWQELLNFFNADGHPHKTWLAETRGQFEEILSNDEFAKADKCQLIEVKMDRLDAPRALQLQAEMSAKLNSA